MLISVVSILLFLAGYFGGKLIVLQQLAISQLTWVSLLTIKDPVITFEALQWLRLNFGYNKLKQYNESFLMAPNVRMQELYSNSLMNYMVSLSAIALPILLAVVIKICSCRKEKEGHYNILYRRFFYENFFYGLLFCSYIIFTSFMVNIRSIQMKSEGMVSGVIIGIIIGIVFLVFYLASILYMFKQVNRLLGDFHHKFKKFQISEYFYAFICLERFISSAVICLTDSLSFGLPIQMGIIGVQLVFVIYKRPYIHGDFIRPIFCLLTTQLILLLMSAVNLSFSQNEKNFIALYAPLAICVILIISLIISLKYFVEQMKQIYQSKQAIKNDKAPLNSEKVKNQDATLKEREYFEEQSEIIKKKNQFQIQIFKNKMFQNNVDLNTIFNSKICHIQANKINLQWQNYEILTSRQLKSEIRQRIQCNHNQVLKF